MWLISVLTGRFVAATTLSCRAELPLLVILEESPSLRYNQLRHMKYFLTQCYPKLSVLSFYVWIMVGRCEIEVFLNEIKCSLVERIIGVA